jgi:hypothetical protein
LEARVWLDRGEEPTLRRGESARLYYRASGSAYVAIFQVDTNGSVRMLFPRSPDENHLVRGGIDYRLLFARSSFWQVDEDPGVGYFFLVASPEPFDLSSLRYSRLGRGWDVSAVAREVYRDPYVAMDEYVAALIPAWRDVPYALDFVTYHVDRRYDYPRFLCYDCHGFRPFQAWNPYIFGCSQFRVVVYEDPYYYPATRYRGDRVVFARPAQPFEPRFAFKERTAGEPTTPLVLAAERRSTAGIGSGGTVPRGRGGASFPEIPPRRGAVGGQGDPGAGRGAPPPSPGRGALDVRTGRPATPTQEERARPTLQPRPSAPAARPAPPPVGSAAAGSRPHPAQPSGGAAARPRPEAPPGGSAGTGAGSGSPPAAVPPPNRPPPGS